MKFTYDKAGVSEDDIAKAGEKLAPYIARLKEVTQNGYADDESSINLPFDKDMLARVSAAVADKKTPGLKYIVVVGIGGSNLGTKAVYDAMFGYADLLERGRFPKMIFADTNNPAFLGKLEKFLEEEIAQPEEVIVNVISKSGGTTETAVNAEIVFNILAKKFAHISERFVVTTNSGSKLWNTATEKGISALSIPEKVGGRYSVLSAVGLFPLAMADINITALLEGAKSMRDKCLNQDMKENPAALSAAVLYEHVKHGRRIHNSFVFNSELESLGKWYRQLTGESIGKEKNAEGKTVHAGITPIVSVGSMDLHSVGQLYLGGPKDKITTFIHAQPRKSNQNINTALFPDLVAGIDGKTAGDIMSAILTGVEIAYEKRQLPFMEVVLDDISPHSLGGFLQFKMMEMMYLGALLGVNAFNQPNVESYKIETKQILNPSL